MNDPSFNFLQHWYPISPIEDLDPQVPTPILLLGRKFVVWKPKSSDRYCVFLDRCPHRLAPLSEGRIDDKTGNLMCSYHGWQFDPQGVCTHIPQAENPDLVAKNRDRYCVKTLPVQEVNGLLWVWPDPDSAEIAHTQPLPISPQIDASQGFVWSSMVRDLEYDWQTLVENVADPSHVPFSHHGVQGDRDQAVPLNLQIVESTPDYIEAHIDRAAQTKIIFRPPCSLEYVIHISPNRSWGFVTYCLPVAAGRSRLVAQFPRNFAQWQHRWIPRWWNHLSERNPVLDGDMILLHCQEQDLQDQAGNWETAYKMPTSADRLVIEFRRWLDLNCPKPLPWGTREKTEPVLPPDRKRLLDRYHQHTLICSSCRRTLKTVHWLQRGLLAYGVIAIAIAAVLPDPLRFGIGLPLVLTALLGLAFYAGLKYWLEPQFYFVDYVHAHK